MPDATHDLQPPTCTKCGERPADGVYLWCADCRERDRDECTECEGNGGCYAHAPDTGTDWEAIARDVRAHNDRLRVTQQPHYTASAVEPIDAIESWGLNYNLGNVVKYIARHKNKGGQEDLRKAMSYLHRELNGDWP